jgi:diguanylate cyclase (GGDEF)-like protein
MTKSALQAMNNGNLAEAQLRALIDVAAVAAGAHRLEEVLELAAERSLEATGAASLSISRWDADAGILRTLVNVGELSPWEERFPEHEVYSVEDYPSLKRLMGDGEWALAEVDDPGADPSQRELLRRLGKESCLAVQMILRGRAWGELEIYTAPGAPRASEQDVEFLRAIADQLVGAIHRAELFAEIERLAYTDALTGVASRRAVETALADACAAATEPGVPALVLCDIDNLKRVNDSGGHEAGDRALCAAAAALVDAAARHGDAVVGRFGGDEFCVLLPSGTAEDARELALDALRRLDAVRGDKLSCGVAARSDPGTGPAELLRAADEAQYRAKRAGNIDVVVAGEDTGTQPSPAEGHHRAFRAGDREEQLARELLELLDEMNGASADDKLSRIRARLERGD